MRTRAVLRGLRIRGICTLCLLLALLPAFAAAPVRVQAARDAERFNGTWEMRFGDVEREGHEWYGELRLWALDARSLQVEFTGHFAYKTPYGPSANTGEAAGVAVLDRGKVRFRDEYGCAFTLALRGEQMVVEQTEFDCFGWRVTAEGSYRRVNASRPEFGLSEPPDA